MDKEQIAARVREIPFWWHSIDLGQDCVTPGRKNLERLLFEWETLCVPELKGKTVLDIGAWDGFFSFAAERAGAARVVALDHFVWELDMARREADEKERREQNLPPRSHDEMFHLFRDPAALPGKRGFDLAKEVLGSQVEERVADWMECDLDALGTFDVVFFLGVLYHMKNPLGALERLARVTREVALIETEAVVRVGYED